MTDKRQFKNKSNFGMFRQLIKFELDNLTTFIDEISEYLVNKQSQIEDGYDSALKEYKENDEENNFDPFQFFEDDFYKYNEVFPKNYYNPILLSIYGLFENWLKKLCDLDNKRGFSNIKVSDLAGENYIEKSRKYLNVVAGIHLEEADKNWQRIKQIQKVRNAIAHNDSNIKTDKNKDIDKQELYNQLQNDIRIKLNVNTGSFYISDKAYLLDTIELVSMYIDFVIKELSARKVVAKNTSMPYDNTGWGHEKSEQIINGVIHCLNLLDEFEARDDKFREEDLIGNIKGALGGIVWDSTKLYSFFCDAHWDVEDRKLIMNEKKEGFEKLKKIYNREKSS